MLLPGVSRDFMSTPDDVLRFQAPEPTFGQYLGEHAAEGFDHTTTSVVLTEKRVQDAERAAYGDYAPALTEAVTETGEWAGAPVPQRLLPQKGTAPAFIRKEDWNENNRYYRKGVAWRENFTEERARIYAEDFDERRARDVTLTTGAEHYGLGGQAAGFFAGMLGGLPDPVNLIPFGGGLAAAGKTANAGLRTALLAGARAGAVEGAAGALATDAIVFPSLSARGEDLGFSDLSLDAAMGAALGGLLGAAGAGLHRYLSGRRRGNVPTDGRTAPPQASFDAVPDRFLSEDFSTSLKENRSGDAARVPGGELVSPAAWVRMNIHGRDRADLLQAFEWAVRDVAAGRDVDVGPLLRGGAVEGRLRVEALAHALEFGSYTDVDFGPLRPDYRAALNAIRTEEGVPLIEGDSLIIPARVARKLYEKRILQEGMSADRLAELLLAVFHGDADFASGTRFPHIQALVRLRGDMADVGFISVNPATGETVVKSLYPEKKDRLGKSLSSKNVQEGRTIPHTVDGEASPPLAAARLSALQDTKMIYDAAAPVNYSVAAPETYTPTPADIARPAGESPAQALLREQGIGKDGMSMEEKLLAERERSGNLPILEEMAELDAARDAEASVKRIEEKGLEILECVVRAEG